jgi:hypothetical protein
MIPVPVPASQVPTSTGNREAALLRSFFWTNWLPYKHPVKIGRINVEQVALATEGK